MLSRFNSKLVRLKVKTVTVDVAEGKFQFQTGSIKSAFGSLFSVSNRGFNSKLVRLKGLMQFFAYPATRMFQFQTGSIKSSVAHPHATLVKWFQFQTGSIKREIHLIDSTGKARFQFQTGSIKR